MENVYHILKKYWGYDQFRPLQIEIIQAVLGGKDVLALLPTGGGKSICFQIPALAKPGICLVITPLIALMKDQVEQLIRREIPAAAIFTGMTYPEIDLILDNCIYGSTKFLYISPERLQTELFLKRLEKMQINLLAVDEAHCISQWGYDFRPAYLNIAAIRTLLPNINIVALTATATASVKEDIQKKLLFKDSVVFQKSFVRNNLAYIVKKTEDKERTLLKLLKKIRGCTIIYVNTRKKTKAIASFLVKNNIAATFYHGGLKNLEREERQNDWIRDKIKVMVATNAFGMGIDKPDVRLVVHLNLPMTLEAYYQEAGRAGRDEQKSYAITLYDEQDIIELRENIQKEYPSISQIQTVYQHLANYYQIAIGSQSNMSYNLDLDNISDISNLKLAEMYQAIKKLESEGIIATNEAFFNPSKLYICTTPKDIYAFQVAHAMYDPIIKAILRLYGGELLTDFCTISENKLAYYLQITPEAVSLQLNKLQQLGIVEYIAQNDKPQITFLQPRYAVNNLPLDTKSLQRKHMLAIKKSEAVIHYVIHQIRCRSQLLLEYFQEVSYTPCNMCDICLSKKNIPYTEENYRVARELILKLLQDAPYHIKELIDSIDMEEEIVINAIRQLLDNEEIMHDFTYKLIRTTTPR